MKVISLLLSIYFLSLACLPCGDTGNLHAVPDQKTINTVRTLDQHHSHRTDACTPLCSCSCCQIATTSPAEAFQMIVLPKTSTSLRTSYAFHIKEVMLTFWHPPKIQG